MKHKLDLRGNALDSLNEGLRKYLAGREGDVHAYKFAVLHFSHFMELLLKSAVVKEHPLLVYPRPGGKNLDGAPTIGLWDALNVLRNAGHTLGESLTADLRWLKQLRNAIEHYEFEMDVRQVRTVLGRILRSAVDVSDTLSLGPLDHDVASECRDVYRELLDEYKAKLANARADARRYPDGDVTNCDICGESNTAAEGADAVRCFFCGETDPIEQCMVCTELYRRSECVVWNDDHPGHVDYACSYCEDHIFGAD